MILALYSSRSACNRLFGAGTPLEIFGSQTCVLCQAREHPRPNLVAIVKCEDHIRPTLPRESFMGTGLALNSPAQLLQRLLYSPGLR